METIEIILMHLHVHFVNLSIWNVEKNQWEKSKSLFSLFNKMFTAQTFEMNIDAISCPSLNYNHMQDVRESFLLRFESGV